MKTETQLTEPMTGTELAIAPSRDLVSAFTSDETVDGIVEKITKAAKAEAANYDVTTAKGRKAIASVAHRVAKSKVALDDTGAELNAERLAKNKAVNTGRQKIRTDLDALRDEIRKPVTLWEAAEADRITALQIRLTLLSVGEYTAENNSDALKLKIDSVARTRIDDTWQEFLETAAKLKDAALETLGSFLDLAKKREDMERELAERRAADLERDRLDAYEAAQVQAEADNAAFDKAKVEAAEAEVKRLEEIEADKQAAVANATKAAEEKAERDRKAAEVEHQRQIELTETRERMDADRKREVEEADRKREIAAQELRDKNENLRSEARAAILEFIKGMDREQVVDAIMRGEIPHVNLTL